jgi:hypothetical protein
MISSKFLQPAVNATATIMLAVIVLLKGDLGPHCPKTFFQVTPPLEMYIWVKATHQKPHQPNNSHSFGLLLAESCKQVSMTLLFTGNWHGIGMW